MASQLFTNNAFSALNGAITDSATSLAITGGHGSRFPNPSAGDYFMLTLVGLDGSGRENAWEVVKVTARTADSLTIVRAQEGTTAVAWSSGAAVELRMTASAETRFEGHVQSTSGAHAASAISGLGTSAAIDIDTDGTLTANSDAKIATQKAVKTAIDALLNASDAEQYKGVIDCSANPNYPAASSGHVYRISVAGKIGGASGANVEINDRLQCIVDGTASGTQAGVGANWWISQGNIDGAVVGPASSVNNKVAVFSGTSGKLLADSGLGLAGNNTGDETTTTAGALINGASDKATPVDADYFGLMDSAASNVLKKLSWANLKATFFAALGVLIAAATSKVTPAAGDSLALSDSAASGATKKLLWSNVLVAIYAMANNALTGIKTATFNGQGSLATTTGAVTVDWTAFQNYLQDEPTGTVTYTFIAPPGPCHLQLIINSDGTSSAQTINLPGSVIQYGAAFAMTANKRSILNFWYDGTSYHMTNLSQV